VEVRVSPKMRRAEEDGKGRDGFCTDMGLIIQIKMDRLQEFDPADVECRHDPSARGYRTDSRVSLQVCKSP
jgi:hypothetical protein